MKAQRERMAALKANDVAKYMRLVQGAKSSRINQLLAQASGRRMHGFGGGRGWSLAAVRGG